MSVLGDAIKAIDEETEVISFLPGINYIFLLISTGGGSDLFFQLSLIASVVGAVLFNHLRLMASGGDTGSIDSRDGEEREANGWIDPRENEVDSPQNDSRIKRRSVSALLFVFWGALLSVSMYFLLQRFSKNWILPEILFFISLGFVLLYPTQILLKKTVKGYRN